MTDFGFRQKKKISWIHEAAKNNETFTVTRLFGCSEGDNGLLFEASVPYALFWPFFRWPIISEIYNVHCSSWQLGYILLFSQFYDRNSLRTNRENSHSAYYWALQISRSWIRKGANGHITVCIRITESNGRNNYNCANEEKPMHGRAQRNPIKSLRNQQKKNNWKSIYGEFHSFAKWLVRWNFIFSM